MDFFIYATLVFTLISCGILAVVLFHPSRVNNTYLAVGFWAICLHIIYKLLWALYGKPGQYEVPVPLGLAYPVLLYLFALSHYRPKLKRKARQTGLFFLPLFIHFVLFAVATLQPRESVWAINYSKVYYVSCILSLLSYAALTARLASQNKNRSAATDVLIRQLTMLCFGLVVLTSFILYELSVSEREAGFEVRQMVYLFLGIGIALIARHAAVNRMAVVGKENLDDAMVARHETAVRESVPTSADLECAAIIEKTLNQHEVLLNPALSLATLAQETGKPRHQLTQFINRYYKKSFYQLVASMRIEYATSVISELGNSITLDSLSYDCGFNSKTSFNRYFKAYTGMTPSEYRCACQQSMKGQKACTN